MLIVQHLWYILVKNKHSRPDIKFFSSQVNYNAKRAKKIPFIWSGRNFFSKGNCHFANWHFKQKNHASI